MTYYHFGTFYDELAAETRGPPGLGFKLNDGGDYDMEGKRLTNC